MTGYIGRIGIYEILLMSPELCKLITPTTDAALVRELASREGMKPLRISGAMKVAEGVTTLDEVVKVAPPANQSQRFWGCTGRKRRSRGMRREIYNHHKSACMGLTTVVVENRARTLLSSVKAQLLLDNDIRMPGNQNIFAIATILRILN